jgi:Ca2+-binding EF-hand superfamily protein
LSPDEIKDVLCFDSSINPKDVDKMIQEIDENGDGEI